MLRRWGRHRCRFRSRGRVRRIAGQGARNARGPGPRRRIELTIPGRPVLHLDGRLVPEDEARIPALDRGLLFGDGVFETLRAYGGAIFRLDRHLDRLSRSMAAIGLAWPHTVRGVREALSALLEANDLNRADVDARIRLTVTGGLSDGRIRLIRSHPPTIIMSAGRLTPPTEAEYDSGIALATSTFRQPWKSPLARIKTIHRLEYLMARESALDAGADDGLLLDDRGNVAEGTASNIAIVGGGRVRTPSLDAPILAGVTREAALEAARNAGFTVEEGVVTVESLLGAEEVFATSTSWEVLAVRSLDGAPIGAGRRGPAVERIHAAFRDIVRRERGDEQAVERGDR